MSPPTRWWRRRAILLTEGWCLPVLILSWPGISLSLQSVVRALLKVRGPALRTLGMAVTVVSDPQDAEALRAYLIAHRQVGLRCGSPASPADTGMAVAVLLGPLAQGGGIDLLRGGFGEVIAVDGIP